MDANEHAGSGSDNLAPSRSADLQTLVDTMGGDDSDSPAVLERGATVGRYVVLGLIGVGGMGVVYAAYDPELDRKVALKLLRPSRSESHRESDGRGRIQREAQALARLSHQHVVAVHDVGTFDDQVFLAMDFVEGTTLRAWLHERPRPWREVLPKLIAAGRGLQAAHDAGIVHRDFKSENVLCGHDGSVRVVDFGLARAATGDSERMRESMTRLESSAGSALELELTREGAVVGTPAFMAPEQHLGGVADARSDQFSFCVAVWEAIYGERPFAGDTAAGLALAVVEGRIRETTRSTDVPAWLRRALVRGLSSRPDQRWPSMATLLHELERDRSGPQRWLALGFGAVVIAGVAFMLARSADDRCRRDDAAFASTWDFDSRAAIEQAFVASGRPYAATTWRTVEEVLDQWTTRWVDLRLDACELTARGEQSQLLLDRRVLCLDRSRRDLEALVAVFLAADADVVERAVAAVEGLPRLADCADTARLLAEGTRPEPADPLLDATLSAARARLAAGDLPAATSAADEAISRAKALGAPDALSRALGIRASIHGEALESEAAIDRLLEAIDNAERAGDDELRARQMLELVHQLGYETGRLEEAHRWAETSMAVVARVGDPAELRGRAASVRGAMALRAGDLAGAEKHFLAALGVVEEGGGGDAEATQILNNLGIVSRQQGRYDSALAYFERVLAVREHRLGSTHPHTAATLNNRANVFVELGRLEEALSEYNRVLEVNIRNVGEDHPSLAMALNNIGITLDELGRDDEAMQIHMRALELRNGLGDPQDLGRADALENLGNLAGERGALQDARRHLEEALTIRQARQGEEHPATLATQLNFAAILDQLGRSRDAIALQRPVLAGFEKTLGPEHPNTAVARINLADALLELGELDEAESLHRRALTDLEAVLGPDSTHVSFPLLGLAEVALARGRNQEAIAWLERAIPLRQSDPGGTAELAKLRFALARAVVTSDPARSRQLATAAKEALAATAPAHPTLAEITRFLRSR